MTTSGDTSEVDLDQLVERIVAADAAAGDVLAAFARAYLSRVPQERLAAWQEDELGAHVRHLFEFAADRRGDDVQVRVFNPTIEVAGYALGGAVVEVAAPDMAFLVDSITNEIQSRGFNVERVVHPVVGTGRDADGRLVEIKPARTSMLRESIQHYELSRPIGEHDAAELEAGVRRVLLDVGRAVDDFEPMQGAIYRMIKVTRDGAARYSKEEIDEAVAFLEWLLDLNFVFLGYREYRIAPGATEPELSVVPGSGLGILRDDTESGFAAPIPMSEVRPSLRARYESGDLLVISKTNSPSRVHRNAKMDYIGVRHIGPDGTVIGEARLVGLFTSKAYMAAADSIPLLHLKLTQIIEAEDLIEGSHSYKEVVGLFNSFPKDELFTTPTPDIRRSIVGLLQLQEQRHVRLFVRRDLLRRSVSVLVVMPRDRFNAALRHRLQALLLERFDGTSIDYRLSLGDAETARLHFTVWVAGGEVPDVSIEVLKAEVVAEAQTWEERLAGEVDARYGAERGRALLEEWAGKFPDHYRASIPLAIAAGDLGRLDELAAGTGQAVVGLQNEPGPGEQLTRLAVYRSDGKLELSAIMPTLEALGLRVVEEKPTRLRGGDGGLFIHDFGVLDLDGAMLDLGDVADRVAGTVVAVLEGEAESDSLNRLIIKAGLDHRQVTILRAYRTYWRRVSPGFTVEYINDAFAAHPEIAADLVELFAIRFDPGLSEAEEAPTLARILFELDRVASLDEDRILRGFLGLVLATKRTNAYLPGTDSLSFKFRSSEVPAMPEPAPLFEIFVFARDMEGIHLRGGRVARGGIRWSTRKEDYRTEVLGLMKAQMTKNAVIVPTGSKGGFVLRRPPADQAELRDAVRAGYMIFIRGLLDVTDNLVGGTAAHPAGVRIHDDGDPYLVVAADKGTATFSDTANEIAAEYEFWLGDAFASGGSAGYDHKALGITARGAWESVKSHFREVGIDIMNEPFTVVGVGDMSGDVFGNGMLLSPQIRLVAAFDHRHIFIDPDPDPTTSFAERRRMFALQRSSWEDYDDSLISAGGGVFSRTAKRIDLTDEMRLALGTDASQLTPDELIQAILRAPIDLLWNGGIGTYVKAAAETNEQVGDRVNDALRVDGIELRCKVIGEGGNLGLTQPGRIEFARRGGRVNTDFIDNSGGVHCSDREVNLKILLGLAEARGELDRAGRDSLVTDVVDDVVSAIVYDNFLQAQIMAQEVHGSAHRLEAYEDLMSLLESEGALDRGIEWLPTTEEMSERARLGEGMTAPEMAVLLAYSKRSLRDWLLDSELPDWDNFGDEAREYFPAEVASRFGDLIPEHPLRRELVATIVANRVVNSEGVTFVTRLMAETGAGAEQVVRAYHIARDVTDASNRWRAVESLVGRVPVNVERELLDGIDGLVEDIARWYLTNPSAEFMSEVTATAKPAFDEMAEIVAEIGPAQWRADRDAAVGVWTEQGVPTEVAIRHVYQEELVHAPDVIEVAQRTGRSVRDVAQLFLLIGPVFEIDWLEEQVAGLPAAGRWHRRAISTVEDDLLLLRRQLAERILAGADATVPQAALDHYLVEHTHELGRLTRFMRSLAVDGVDDVGSVIVAIRQIRSLAA